MPSIFGRKLTASYGSFAAESGFRERNSAEMICAIEQCHNKVTTRAWVVVAWPEVESRLIAFLCEPHLRIAERVPVGRPSFGLEGERMPAEGK